MVSRGVPTLALSSAAVFPERLEYCFDIAQELGYDAIEIMVWTDPSSQDPHRIQDLIQTYQIPVVAVHAPCLLVTMRVWGSDGGTKLRRSVEMAQQIGAGVVVVHPPFRWQARYAREFARGSQALYERTGVRIAVENMFPIYLRGRAVSPYAPHWDVAQHDFTHLTFDLSHTSVSRSDPIQMLTQMGDRLTHVHLADGSGKPTDEHLLPGEGHLDCTGVLGHLARGGYDQSIVVEVSTRAADDAVRREQLAGALEFTKRGLRRPPGGQSRLVT